MRLGEKTLIAFRIVVMIAAGALAACGDGSQQGAHTTKAAEAKKAPVDPALLTTQINSAPLFDAQQAWSSGYLKAKGRGPGVIVGPGGNNPNVFAQQFSARPGESFKVIARASSVDTPKVMARIQINWTGAQGKFISVSSGVFEVTPEARSFEHVVQAPPDALAGTLYVVADGPDSVVRYTEMRLLGEPGRAQPVPPAPSKASGVSVSPAASASGQPNPFPKPPNLTPLDGSGRQLTVAESQYYFYHATKAMQRKARERGMDFIMYVMPDYNIARLMPAIQQLRSEGIKVLAYEPQGPGTSGVDTDWYWQKADSHWTEAAVRLTADEILYMWNKQAVSNRPFSKDLMSDYGAGFPANLPWVTDQRRGSSPVKSIP